MSTDNSKREAAARRAFLAPEETHLGRVTLRPVTLGTMALLEETRNEFLFPRGPVQNIPDPETGEIVQGPVPENELFAALAFGYIHSADLSEVRRAAFSPAYFREQVLAFGEELQPVHLRHLIEEIGARLRAIRALMFSVKAKPEEGTGKGPTPPPN